MECGTPNVVWTRFATNNADAAACHLHGKNPTTIIKLQSILI